MAKDILSIDATRSSDATIQGGEDGTGCANVDELMNWHFTVATQSFDRDSPASVNGSELAV